MKREAITFLLIGMLIGAILGSFLLGQVKAQVISYYDEVYYLKKIYTILTDIQSDVSWISFNLDNM